MTGAGPSAWEDIRMKDRRLRGAPAILVSVALGLAACTSDSPATGGATAAASRPAPAVVTPLTQTLTSEVYGYSIRYPNFFDPSLATTTLPGLPLPIIDSEGVDQLNGSTIVIVMGGGEIGGQMSLPEFTAETATEFCGAASVTEQIRVGGQTATLSTFGTCKGLFHQWVTIVRGSRGYHIVWANQRGTEAADRALFQSMLATFDFGP
jgi:hypothetical protein